jgi:DNA repair exonuclease SbcCD ATPase subunit
MDGAAPRLSKKSSSATADSEKTIELKERLERLLREAADLEVELSRADGTIKGIPHYSVIEGRAHELGKQLSQRVQERQMNELVASQPTTGKCPGCGTRCELRSEKRDVKSVDGQTELQELAGYCDDCRRFFFPAA